MRSADDSCGTLGRLMNPRNIVHIACQWSAFLVRLGAERFVQCRRKWFRQNKPRGICDNRCFVNCHARCDEPPQNFEYTLLVSHEMRA